MSIHEENEKTRPKTECVVVHPVHLLPSVIPTCSFISWLRVKALCIRLLCLVSCQFYQF